MLFFKYKIIFVISIFMYLKLDVFKKLFIVLLLIKRNMIHYYLIDIFIEIIF
jgi:hypothetical protein